MIQEENTFLEEDETNTEDEEGREAEEESKISSILNRTEYEEGKQLIEEKKLNELSQYQEEESSLLPSQISIGEVSEKESETTEQLDKELEEFADMELVQIADEEEEEISNTADFNGRSGRRGELFSLRKVSLQDTTGGIVESERQIYGGLNSQEVSVVNLPTVVQKVSSRRDTKEE